MVCVARSIYMPATYIDILMISTCSNTQLNRLLEDTTFTRCAWSSVIGKALVCHRGTRNRHDPFDIATCNGTTVVQDT